MTPIEQFLVALVGALAADLEPLMEKLIAGAAAGQDPLEVLADENVVDILPEPSRTAVTMALQRMKYGAAPPPSAA